MADQSQNDTPTVDKRAPRDELEAQAVKLGLAGVATYQNKPTVVQAIERVLAGENAAEVDNEYQNAPVDDAPTEDDDDGVVAPVTVTDDETPVDGDDEPTEDDTPADDENDTPTDDTPAPAPRAPRPRVTQRNQGHPTKFDEFGAPRF